MSRTEIFHFPGPAMFVGLVWELLGGNSAQLHPYQTYSWGLMTALHAADSVDSCRLPGGSQSTLDLPAHLWCSDSWEGLLITVYDAIPSKNLRCQDALLEGSEALLEGSEARAYACGD